jgi:glycosyltransferase involved in cell wall biosynthesis
MIVSVIIPTYNGAPKLPTIFKALERQSQQEFETIVVVDGSTDHTLDLLSGLETQLRMLRVVVQENMGRAAVRNRGAREASGDLLIFFDDDMRPEPDCIQQHLAHHQSLTNPSMAVGKTPEDMALCQTDFHVYRAMLSRKWVKHLEILSGPIPEDQTFLAAANFSVLKETFFRLGGFNEALTDAEDYELALRAKKACIPIYFLPRAISWHDDLFSMQRYIQRQKEYQVNHRHLAGVNPDYQPPAQKPIGSFKKGVIRLFRQPVWVKTIDGPNPLRLLPRALRYKIYDLVIYAHLST